MHMSRIGFIHLLCHIPYPRTHNLYQGDRDGNFVIRHTRCRYASLGAQQQHVLLAVRFCFSPLIFMLMIKRIAVDFPGDYAQCKDNLPANL